MKKIIVLIMSVILVLGLAGCTKKENKVINTKPLVVLVLDTSGLGGNSFNDLAWAGCEKAKEKYDIDIRCLESENESDYENNISSAVLEGADLVIVPGENLSEATKKVAKEYSDSRFAIIDGNVKADNIVNINFEEEEEAL